MGRQSTTNLLAVLAIIAGLLTAWITIRATFETASWGGVPPKRLEATYIGPNDPLKDLANAESHLAIRVESDGQKVDNIRVAEAIIENKGQSPILASDMFEPLSIKSDEPWHIINVVNNVSYRSAVKLKWNKVGDDEFRADPALMNPGDTVSTTVYLAWKGSGTIPVLKDAPIHWKARINNLHQIDEPDILAQIMAGRGPITVSLGGWGVPFTLFAFLIYNALSIMLLFKAGVVRLDFGLTLLWIPAAGLLNIAAAEAGATYAFGTASFFDMPVDAVANLPPILANIAMLIGLGIRSVSYSRRKAPEHLTEV